MISTAAHSAHKKKKEQSSKQHSSTQTNIGGVEANKKRTKNENSSITKIMSRIIYNIVYSSILYDAKK